MKTSSFYTFLAFAAGLTFALPQGTTVVETATVIPYAASPYPASPTTNEFKYANYKENSDTDKAARTTVHDAFLDYSPVLQQAILSLDDTNDKTFDRWFQEEILREDQSDLDGRTYVKGVLGGVFQASDTSPVPASVVTSLTCFNNDFANNCKDGVRAYTLGTAFHFCPLGLEQTTKASDIKCSNLGNAVSGSMMSVTGTIIHEFMHQKAAGDNAPNSIGHIGDIAYGAATCMRLNKGPKKNKTFNNADSYKWFALNAYYNKICDKAFGDPVITDADFEASETELVNSPEYDSADADGSLAGV